MTGEKRRAKKAPAPLTVSLDGGVLSIDDGKVKSSYRLECLECHIGGVAFRLEKLNDDKVYDVRLADEGCQCDCKSFLTRDYCRHVRGLLKLAAEHRLRFT